MLDQRSSTRGCSPGPWIGTRSSTTAGMAQGVACAKRAAVSLHGALRRRISSSSGGRGGGVRRDAHPLSSFVAFAPGNSWGLLRRRRRRPPRPHPDPAAGRPISIVARDPARPNVVILAADSFRNDHVDPALTPHLSELATHGTRFARAYVTIARTFPSWTTILTGRYPHHHGIRTTLPRHEDRDHPFDTMAARFRKAGWATGVVADYGGDVFHLADLGFGHHSTPRVSTSLE